jgi:hypothetical protein
LALRATVSTIFTITTNVVDRIHIEFAKQNESISGRRYQGGLRGKVPADASELVFECCAAIYLSVSKLFFHRHERRKYEISWLRIFPALTAITDDLVTGLAPTNL